MGGGALEFEIGREWQSIDTEICASAAGYAAERDTEPGEMVKW
jgi:hypothetical protein